MKSLPFGWALSALATLGLLGSAPAVVASEETWHRDTALSPDGENILFTHMGDIYRVASAGGTAVPLTSSTSVEVNPAWSADGEWIAYGSDLYGNLDVFVMPAQGGMARRLTFHDSDDVVSGFSADSQRVLFSSSRYDALDASIDPQRQQPELYEVDVAGGTPTQLTTLHTRHARWNRAGDALLFADDKGENFHRKRDDSPFARDIWRLEPPTGQFERLTTNRWNDHTPAWDETGNGFYFLSERSGSLNVWHQRFEGGEASARQVTDHDTHPVRDLSVSDAGAIAYNLHGQVYFGAPGRQPRAVDIRIATSGYTPLEHIAANEDIAEFVLSPDGMEIAYIMRGEVFATSVEFDTTRRITHTPGEERNLAFAPDGRALLYASQRLDQWQIYESTLADAAESHFFRATRVREKLLVPGEEGPGGSRVAATHPAPSPDGDRIAYLSNWREIRVFDRSRRRSLALVDGDLNYSMGNDDINFSWSPDSRWLALDVQADGRLFFPNIAIVRANGSGPPQNLTRSGYTDAYPVWHASGGIISWISGRFGLREHGGHGTQYDVFAQFLNQDAWDEFRRTEEDLALAESRQADEEDEEDEDREPDPVIIDLEGATERQARLTIHSSDLAGFALDEDAATLYYLSAFEDGYDLWSHKFREEETVRLVAIGADQASLELSADNDLAIVLADGTLKMIDLEEDEPALEDVPVSASFNLDAAAERAAMLHHVYQTTRDRIYWPGVLGEANWDQRYADYAAKLPAINNNRDFSELVDELVGELNVSHAAGRYRPEPGDETGAIGAVLDLSDPGAGIRIARVLTQGPLARASDRAAAGNRIVAVNDTPLDAGANYFELLNNSVGDHTRLTLADRKGRFDVILRPVGLADEAEWMREQWVESRRALVDELSAGRLGYVYLPGMSDEIYRRVYSDVFGRDFAREAIVIDVRDNRGGDLVDWLVQLFSGTPYMTNVPNGRKAQGEPLTEWVKPSIALTNEGAYSDGHCFVAAWKNLGVSTLVGTPVTGTCTYAGWEMLPSGDVLAGTPRLGILDPAGDWLERKTTEPDVLIYAHPNTIVAGEDVQLKRAVEVLLNELDSAR